MPDPKRMIAVQTNIVMAQGLLSVDRPEEALEVLRRALARDPANKGVYLTVGMANARLGRHEVAVDLFLRCVPQLEKVLETSPLDTAAWYHLGLTHDGAGRPEEARAAWNRALEIDPEHELTRNAIRNAAR